MECGWKRALLWYLKIFNILIVFLIGSAGKDVQAAPYFSPPKTYSKNFAHSNRTSVVYLIGFAGTGKYTIAKEIAKSGYKIVDNHLINNPIFSLITEDSVTYERVLERVNEIRNIVFSFMREDMEANYVLTNELLENRYHRDIYRNVQKTALDRGSVFVPVKLIISPEERAKRIINAEREQYFKTTDIQEVYHPTTLLNFSHDNLLELDVTMLSAKEAAQKIMLHVGKVAGTD